MRIYYEQDFFVILDKYLTHSMLYNSLIVMKISSFRV